MQEPERAIRSEIERRGPMSFDRFMELALYGPGGFYELPPIGAGDDAAFVTSSHVHPVFAELLADALRQLHSGLGDPDPLRIVEVGAGDGTLASGLLDALDERPVDYAAVERSQGARDALSARGMLVVDRLEKLAPIEGVLLANELLDNLPFRRVRMSDEGPAEIVIDIAQDLLVERERPASGELEGVLPEGIEPGNEFAFPSGALAFIDDLAACLTRGYAVLIDYGAMRGPAGAVHGYRGQRVVEDVLVDPGSADITAGVDLGAVAHRAQERGLEVLGAPSQHAALLALGFETWTRGQLERQGELLDERAGLEAVRMWSGRSRATLLADPAALGRLRWLVLATPELPEPDWLTEALA
ncbi:MAG: SAM-dependent methyltransferase [Actinomycetota bacterium]